MPGHGNHHSDAIVRRKIHTGHGRFGAGPRSCLTATTGRRGQGYCLCQQVAECGRKELLQHSERTVSHHLRVKAISALFALDRIPFADGLFSFDIAVAFTRTGWSAKSLVELAFRV